MLLNGSWTHSVHQLSQQRVKASGQAASASVLRSVQMVCSGETLLARQPPPAAGRTDLINEKAPVRSTLC